MTLQDYYDALDAAKNAALAYANDPLSLSILTVYHGDVIPTFADPYNVALNTSSIAYIQPGEGSPPNGYIAIYVVFPPFNPTTKAAE